MKGSYAVDAYVLDTLMADLVGHDHRPSAFLVYLALVAAAGENMAALSFADLAERTGLSKRTTQYAIAALGNRGLIEISRRGVTETPEYRPLSPWRRPGPTNER
jgi:DNA-binding transcriptional ArsR family regulator